MIVDVDPGEVERLVQEIENQVHPEQLKEWPGGYPDDLDAAVLDAVFSMQATYSADATKGPRGVVTRWNARPASHGRLSEYVSRGEELAAIAGNASKANRGRTLKADIAAEAASNLAAIGIVDASDIETASDERLGEAKRAWTGVGGLGSETFEYFTMLLGRPGVKADVMIRRFVAGALGLNDVSSERASALVKAAAQERQEDPTTLDHYIWQTQRSG